MARRGARRDGGKEQFWRRWLRHWRRSGLNIRAFCAKQRLSEASFYAWRRTIAARDQAKRDQQGNRRETSVPDGAECADGQPVFVPLRVVPTAAEMAFEVVLSQGRVVRVPAHFDPAMLRQLLAILGEGSSC